MLKRVGRSGGFEVLANDPKYKSVNGLLYSKDGKTLVRIPLGRKKVIINDGCTTVSTGSYSYYVDIDCKQLSEIVFPKTVTKITDDVYDGYYDYGYDSGHEHYYGCKDIKVSLNMDNLDRESIHKLWLTNKYWRNSLKDELIRKGFAKLNEENERMLMLSGGYLPAQRARTITMRALILGSFLPSITNTSHNFRIITKMFFQTSFVIISCFSSYFNMAFCLYFYGFFRYFLYLLLAGCGFCEVCQ